MIILQKQKFRPNEWPDRNCRYIYIDMLRHFEISACIFYKTYNAEYKCRLLKVLEKKLKKTECFATRSGFPDGVRRKSHPIRLPHLQTRGKWLNIRIFVLSENILIILQNVYFMNGISNRRVKMQAAENLQGRRGGGGTQNKNFLFCG